MVYRLKLTYDQIVDILDVKYIVGSTIGYTLITGIYEISNIKLMLKPLLPNKVEVNITIDDFRLKSYLTTNKTIRFSKISLCFITILGFTQSHSEVLDDIKRSIQILQDHKKAINSLTLRGSTKSI